MLLEPLVTTINTIKTRISTHGTSLRQNETRTRAALIDPLLTALGWDTSDPALVTPEYRTGGWADYALIGVGNKPAAIIEAKRLGSVVENHLEQAVGYCIQEGIAYAGVTDGNHWQLYRTFEPVALAEKLVLDVSIDNAPAHESALKLLLLWTSNLESGRPVAANVPISGLEEGSLGELSGRSTLDIRRDVDTERLISLTAVKPNPGDKPPVMVQFPDGEQRPISTWRDVLIQPAEWLVATGRLGSSDFPLSDANGMSFINSSPCSPWGTEFRNSREISGGIFLNVNWTNFNMVKRTINLLRRFGVSAESIQLGF